MSKEVTIYTFSTCPFCIRAKELLDRENIKYKEIEISNDREKLDVLEQKTGHSTVPQIFVSDKFIGGCDDLMEIHSNGKFNDIFR
ncbi:glutaredoxin 3 [Clostridium sp. D2Q-11]|uniref:Glutaredoxin n=1 Tax=Anaeromonas frigoriresistens TaxID=2683708 RepID=A0A942Z669_9FIRM|nr:glutaredoxin 3 [Anaeromonas frigoriresistens]MBS4537262.1 glutaredoxin 3 [Anaeromonas frigoriresistens]